MPAPLPSPAPRDCGRWCRPGRSAIGGWPPPCHLWAFAALTDSAAARRYYDAHRARGATHHQALRALANRLVGILHGCLRHRQLYDEQVARATSTAAGGCLTKRGGGAGKG